MATVSTTGLVTGVGAGSATITYTNTNGCTQTATVTINAKPTITGTLSVCVGSTTQLTGSATASTTAPWVSSNTALATVSTTGLVTGVAAGSATITYTNTNGCTQTATVTINAVPVATSISQNTTTPTGATQALALCTTSTAKILTLATGYVGSIQWERRTSTDGVTWGAWANAPGTSTAAGYTVSSAVAGDNQFRVKLTSGVCTAIYSTNTIAVWYKTCLKTVENELNEEAFDVLTYPNPFMADFTISLTGESEELIGIDIYDVSGKLLEHHVVLTDELESLKVGSELSGGIYNVVITSGNQHIQKKVVKH